MTKISKLKIVLVACILSFVAVPVFAAEISFDTKTPEIKVNQLFEVGVFINTDEESINAIEGKIIFPQDLLEVKNVNDGNSIINFWIEKPKSASEDQIAFSGIVPGGYNDSQGLIFSITFLAKKEGGGAIEFSGVKALRNDGQGTEAPLIISNFRFVISETAKSAEQIQIIKEDRDPPEDFKPEIVQNPDIFNGEWFLVFATQDKGSGIAYYAIRETRRKINLKRETDAKWKEAESPYVLKDQGLRSFVYVKAVDKAGNERITVVEPRYPMKWYENYFIWIIIILGTLLAIIIGYLIRKLLWKNPKNKYFF